MAKELTLEEKVELALETAQRAKDYQDIMNVMSKHMYYHNTSKHREEHEEIWALKTPGARWTIHGTVYEGEETIKQYHVETYEQRRMKSIEAVAKFYPVEVKPENMCIGSLTLHVQTTPVLEVAKDGQTAKGVWYSPGMIAGVGEDGKPHARWMWEKYGVDFVKEDGKWKIWHIINCYDFVIPFGKDFDEVEWPIDSPPTILPGARPTRILEGGDPYKRYSPVAVPQLFPKLPEPYDTWDDSMSY